MKKTVKNLLRVVSIMLVISLSGIFAACNKNTYKFFRANGVAETVYVIKSQHMTRAELAMIYSLQGIVAQDKSAIYIEDLDKPQENQEMKMWLTDAVKRYSIDVQYTISPWFLVERFKNHINGGRYVLFSLTETSQNMFDLSINHATTISGADKYLMIDSSIQDKAVKAGLTLGRDATGLTTREVFSEYKDKLSPKYLVHQKPDKIELRDYSIAGKSLCYYADYESDKKVNQEILEWADDNAPVFGWTENELDFVTTNSLMGKMTIPADWSSNLSFFSSLEKKDIIKQENYVQRNITPEKGKHYLAIVMSDGDNIQWTERSFVTNNKFFGSRHRGDFRMTWGLSPSLYDVSPNMLEKVYEEAAESDQIITGPGGLGYVNISDYKSDSIKDYAKLTADYMKNTDMQYINFIDSHVNTEALDQFGKQKQIKGGIWSIGNKYIAGAGSVHWSNKKPFISARETLWRIPGDDNGNKYHGFVERVAQRINGYKEDYTQIEGYTVLVAHAWSIGSMDYISRFVDCLDENIELVTVGEMIDMVAKNVKKENVTILDDIMPDYFDSNLAPISTEQLKWSEIKDKPATDIKSFQFYRESELKGFVLGNAGLEYDRAAIVPDKGGCVLLEGSDLEDVADPLPNAWMYNMLNISSADNYMQITASAADDADTNMRVRVLYEESGNLKTDVLADGFDKPLSTYGYYLINKSSSLSFVFDISKYHGKKILLSIEQDDNGEGSGEMLFVRSVKISDTTYFPQEINRSIPLTWEMIKEKPATDVKIFNFEAPEELDGFDYSSGEREYDRAVWTGEDGGSIMLEGSDLGTRNDIPNAWLYNMFNIADTDNVLETVLKGSGNANTYFRIRVLYEESGVAKEEYLTDGFDASVNSANYYLISGTTSRRFTFDISKYQGKKVAFIFEQNDNGEGSGEILYINSVKLLNA